MVFFITIYWIFVRGEGSVEQCLCYLTLNSQTILNWDLCWIQVCLYLFCKVFFCYGLQQSWTLKSSMVSLRDTTQPVQVWGKYWQYQESLQKNLLHFVESTFLDFLFLFFLFCCGCHCHPTFCCHFSCLCNHCWHCHCHKHHSSLAVQMFLSIYLLSALLKLTNSHIIAKKNHTYRSISNRSFCSFSC